MTHRLGYGRHIRVAATQLFENDHPGPGGDASFIAQAVGQLLGPRFERGMNARVGPLHP